MGKSTTATEYIVTRTSFMMWLQMVREMCMICAGLQVVIFSALCYLMVDQQSLILTMQYAWAWLLTKSFLFDDATLNVIGVNVACKDLIQIQTYMDIVHVVARRLILALCLSCAVYVIYPLAVVYFKRKAAEADEDIYIRGARLVSKAALIKIVAQMAKRAREVLCLLIAGIPVSRSIAGKHTCTFGTPGSGKTNELHGKLRQIRSLNERFVIHDPKGELWQYYGRPGVDILLNLMDRRAFGWSILNEVKKTYDIPILTASLIPPQRVEDAQAFWSNAARDVLTAIIYALFRLKRTSNLDIYTACSMTIPDIIKLITVSVGGDESQLRAVRGAEAGYSYLQDERLGANVKAVLMQYIKALQFMSDGDLCLTDWIRDPHPEGDVFICSLAELREPLKPINSLAIDLLSRRHLSLDEDEVAARGYTHYILEEMPQLNRLSSIVEFLQVGRSKKAVLDCRFQGLGGGQYIYGREGMSELMNACSNKMIFQLADVDSQKYFSELIGEAEIAKTNVSRSARGASSGDGRTLSGTETVKRLVLPSELSDSELLTGWCYVSLKDCPWAKIDVPEARGLKIKNTAFEPRDGFDMATIMEIQADYENIMMFAEHVVACAPKPTITNEVNDDATAQVGPGGFRVQATKKKNDLGATIEDMDNF